MVERLAELAGSETSGDNWIRTKKVDIERSFQAYCDAKIWEFALSKMAVMNFKERPTPLGMVGKSKVLADSGR